MAKKKGKRAKRLLVLCGVLAVCIGGTAGLSAYNTAQEEKAARESEAENEEKIVAFAIAENELAGFTTTYAGEEIAFARADGEWILADDTDFPLRQSSAGNMAGALQHFEATDSFTAQDVSDYGLDAPVCTVKVVSVLGDENVIEIGDKNTVTGDYYLRVDGSDTIYMVESHRAKYFQYEKMDMIDLESFPSIDPGDITRVALSDGQTIIRTDDGSFVDQNGTRLNLAKVNSYLENLVSVSTVETLDDRIEGEESAAYGFDAPALTVEIDYALETAATLDRTAYNLSERLLSFSPIGRIPGVMELIRVEKETTDVEETAARIADRWGKTDDGSRDFTLVREKDLTLHFGKQVEGGDYTFTHSRTTRAQTVMQEKVAAVQACSAADFRGDYVCELNMSEVASIEMHARGMSKTVTRNVELEEKEDGTFKRTTVYRMGGEEIEYSLFSRLYNRITTMKAQAYLESAATAGEASENGISLCITMTDGERVAFTLEPYDGSFYLACIDGTAQKLISKRDVEDLLTAFDELAIEAE